MDNKKKVRNLLLYLGIPILMIIITAAVLSSNKSNSPKTSELEQYFVQDMVDSFEIDYGTGSIDITLKEGLSPIKSSDSDKTSATTAVQSPTESKNSDSHSKKSKVVVRGQLADILTIIPRQTMRFRITLPAQRIIRFLLKFFR